MLTINLNYYFALKFAKILNLISQIYLEIKIQRLINFKFTLKNFKVIFCL